MRILTGSSDAGRLPPQVRVEPAAQDVLILEEGLKGSITYRNYRAPGRYAALDKSAIRAALAITADRVVIALSPTYKELDVPRSGPWTRVVAVRAERSDLVCFSWRVEAFHRDRSGTEEVRLRTPRAPRIAEILASSGPGAAHQAP